MEDGAEDMTVTNMHIYSSQDSPDETLGNLFTWCSRKFHIGQFSSVAQSCPTLCYPMDYSTPGLPVHHQLLEFTQPHMHRVGNAIQPSHPLLSSSPPAFNLSKHQGLFSLSQFFTSSIGASASISVLPMNIQD